MNKLFLVVTLFLSVFAAFAQEQDQPTADKQPLKVDLTITDDAKLLSTIMENTLTYSASFEQNVYRENSDKPDQTLGQFLIQRPNHFRWQTSKPFDQSIIADGKALWTYDPELEQVTIQNQQAVLTDSPLLLLTSSVHALVSAFEITLIEDKEKDNQHLFSLEPRQNGMFESVHILVKEGKIKEFFLLDTLGGRTSVIFSDIKLNGSIDINQFIFVPPEGIDIIDSREIINE